MCEPLRVPKDYADRLAAHMAGRVKRTNTWNKVSESRQQKALTLYKKTGSKTHVCKELRMGRNTLNNILEKAGVVM